MKPFPTLGIATVTALAGVWFAGLLAPATGSGRLILRIGLGLIILAAAAVTAWFILQKKKGTPAVANTKPGAGNQLDLLFHEAESKLASAQLGPGTRIANLPVFLVVGSPGSAKTTAMVHSSLEPELLAGEIHADGVIAPTPFLNVWYGNKSVFVEAGEKVAADGVMWSRLIRRLTPGKLKSAVGKGGQASRAVVLCLDMETVLRQSAESNLTAARSLRERLGELASSLGVSIPVYVLLTKADRLSFFQEFVANLNGSEANQLLGTTLSVATPTRGTYSEEQTARLKDAYDDLFYALAARRPEYLAREHSPDRTPAVYEFPREFRKFRAAVVQFLVELCRPSQLTIGPFLRGFYFCGVRPVVIQDVSASVAPAQSSGPKLFNMEAEATRIFQPMARDQVPQPAQGALHGPGSSRKVPQWVFLPSFFQQVLLADTVALGTSASSTNTSTTRRWLLGTIASLCLCLSAAFTISYLNNHSLQERSVRAASSLPVTEVTSAAPPSLTALRNLDELRLQAETLVRFRREGAPFSFRWGLFAGDRMYAPVRQIYFDRFRQLLLLPVQKAWIANLAKLPANPSPSNPYDRTYDTLKGYLITTSNHEKSTKEYLAPLLGARWTELFPQNDERGSLARKQFDFYSEELKTENPFSGETNAEAVKRGRFYLAAFGGAERIYRSIIVEANKQEKLVNFNRDVKDSEQEVINNVDVPGAFTKGGWARVQSTIKNSNGFYGGDRWVLGDPQTGADVHQAGLEAELRKRYLQDFIFHWRGFINRSSVVPYKDVKDAAEKLAATSGPQSPLLALFHVASQNTSVDEPQVQAAFKPLYAVEPSSCSEYVCRENADYMKELAGLQFSLEEITGQPGAVSETSAAKSVALAGSARLKTREMAQTFGVDPEGHLDRKMQQLLEEPITQVERVLKPKPPDAQGLCQETKLLTSKYPFNPKASAQATIADISAVFQPKTGALWKFYDANLQKLLVQQGNQYAPAPGTTVQVTTKFLDYFNHMAAFSRALYSEGATAPNLTFKVKPVKLEGLDAVALRVDAQTLSYNKGAEPNPASFNWPGGNQEMKASTTPPLPWFTETGIWAMYRFLTGADRISSSGHISHLEYDVKAGIGRNPNTVGVVTLELDMGANPPIFQKGYLSGFSCVVEVAK